MIYRYYNYNHKLNEHLFKRLIFTFVSNLRIASPSERSLSSNRPLEFHYDYQVHFSRSSMSLSSLSSSSQYIGRNLHAPYQPLLSNINSLKRPSWALQPIACMHIQFEIFRSIGIFTPTYIHRSCVARFLVCIR